MESTRNPFGGPRRCKICENPVTGQFLPALGGLCHMKCLVCSSCNKEIQNGSETRVDLSEIKCLQCYNDSNGIEPCSICDRPINDLLENPICSGGKRIHQQCFTCHQCDTSLSPGWNFAFKGKLFCSGQCIESFDPNAIEIFRPAAPNAAPEEPIETSTIEDEEEEQQDEVPLIILDEQQEDEVAATGENKETPVPKVDEQNGDGERMEDVAAGEENHLPAEAASTQEEPKIIEWQPGVINGSDVSGVSGGEAAQDAGNRKDDVTQEISTKPEDADAAGTKPAEEAKPGEVEESTTASNDNDNVGKAEKMDPSGNEDALAVPEEPTFDAAPETIAERPPGFNKDEATKPHDDETPDQAGDNEILPPPVDETVVPQPPEGNDAANATAERTESSQGVDDSANNEATPTNASGNEDAQRLADESKQEIAAEMPKDVNGNETTTDGSVSDQAAEESED